MTMPQRSIPTLNPFFALIRDSAWMLCDGFRITQEKGRRRTYEGEFRGATLHAIAALRCFANNCILQKGEDIPNASLHEKLPYVITLWNAEPLVADEITWLAELEEIEAILQNPSNVASYDANSPHGNMIDFDRTPVFKIAKHCESWSAEYAMIALGITLRFVNNLVTSRLKLSTPEIAAIFGYTMRSPDGFLDILDPTRYRPASRALDELRESPLIVHMSGYRGFEPQDYTLHFLPPTESPAE